MNVTKLVMEHTELCILREDDLVVLICMSSHIVPMQHRVSVNRVIEETSCHLYVRLVWMQGHSYRPTHSVAVLDLTDPDSLGSVPVIHEFEIDRILACCTMMVEYIPFYTS